VEIFSDRAWPIGNVRFAPDSDQIAALRKSAALCHLLPDAPQQTAIYSITSSAQAAASQAR